MNGGLEFKNASFSINAGGTPAGGEFRQSVSGEGYSFDVKQSPERFSLSLESDRDCVIGSVSAVFGFEFKPGDALFLNGYQSWTDSHEHFAYEKLHGIDKLPGFLVKKYAFDSYGDYNFVSYGGKGRFHGFTYAYVRRGEKFLLFGSLCEETGFTVIRFDVRKNLVTLEKDCRDHRFTGSYGVFDLAVIEGGEDEVFDRYFELLGIPRCTAKKITGYTSWYNRYEDISESSVGEDLEGFIREGELPDVFQIDDGYESAVGDWLAVDEKKFPGGMKAAAEKIRAAGMTPGIWLAPFAAEKESRLAAEHPDWLLHGKNGDPVVGGGNWSGFYALDIYHPEVREYLKKVFDTVINDWGYRLVKLDFLYAACVVPRPDRTRAQVMFDGMRFLRQLCGDALILGCGVPLAAAFGLVDYCRIGCDVSLSWDDAFYMRFMHRERVSTKNSLLNTVFRRQLDGRAFRCDPDVFLLRSDNISLDDAQKRTLATVNALFGGVSFTSDNVGAYDASTDGFYRSVEKLDRGCVSRVEHTAKEVRVFYTANGVEHSVTIPK